MTPPDAVAPAPRSARRMLLRGATQQLPWWPLTAAGALGVSLLLLSGWSLAERHVIRGEIAELHDLYVRAQRIADRQPAVSAVAARYATYLEQPASADAAFRMLLQWLEQLAGMHQVQLASVAPRPSPPHAADAAIREYAVEIEGVASVEALAKFLHAIEYGPRLLRIDRLRLNATPRYADRLEAQLLITYVTLSQ